MKVASLTDDIQYHESRPTIQVLMETETGKEIRIAFKKDQIMKEHKTPFPIVVEIFEGAIDFGVNGTIHNLKRGDLIALDGGVPHDLRAIETSTVRLSLNKADSATRVDKVAKNS
ncbi:cupin domain-containing protein [Aequorivita sp. SDUM287046]|uniref:Cupin domain-containing protein n=1 Tax=Aequorivita aurantiaca TaxID=3053356 RepID=A0ABT8DNG4_9FLAO|nr:cupin domain-containing protein [Aequorivita aurantiaca]MDN3724715.1 cupin domain-containing protein [Aequorivita aurantiaca]